jgi:hypothetical protein
MHQKKLIVALPMNVMRRNDVAERATACNKKRKALQNIPEAAFLLGG